VKPDENARLEWLQIILLKGEKFMEYENHYASKGVAGTGLGLGIAGTALGLMNNGNLGNIFGGGTRATCSEDHYINRYEAAQSARIAELETEVKLRDANTYTDGKILDLYRYVDGKFGIVEAHLSEQKVYNATNTASLACLQGQVAQLASLTKVIIPATSICPPVMPQYNSWTAPTTTTGA
jgi:hypothetical protein